LDGRGRRRRRRRRRRTFIETGQCSIQWCQTNFASIDDVENCLNRGGFRRNIKSIEEMLWVFAPLKPAYLG
jgi:hypothetical protein